MKTAISVPDETFDRVSRRAHELGMSRSEFFATAAQRFLDALDEESLTDAIDEALTVMAADVSGRDAVAAGHQRLAETDEW